MVRPDSFERGQLRLTCISTVHSVYSEQAELVINEERPQIASVLGTRDGAGGKVNFKIGKMLSKSDIRINVSVLNTKDARRNSL